jgi:hypothetical protein
MSNDEYYRARQSAEQEAASRAACPEARKAHDEMARAYSQLLSTPRARLSVRF